MNFKRKLWWAQHKTDVYKYGTILFLVLIVTISIIYFTYSKFSSTSEATMYETTVEPFIKNDYFIASYIDGEWSNEIPGKNDGYIIDKVVCDNGATGTWDHNDWEIRISNATKKTKCSLFFVTGSLIDVELYQGLIPVRYKLFNANNGTSKEQAVDIIFEKVGTEKSNGTENGEWLTHPAFTFGNTELPGIWAAKFEASGTTDNYTIKPNQKSLTNINLATMFSTSRSTILNASKYGLNNNVDTHMMKNMEWGAIAFLTNSIYGRYNDASTCIESGCEVWINNNSNFTTGCTGTSTSADVSDSQTACASGYDWKTKGVNASTTGNQYGIYDMVGGAFEYVMGVQKDSSGNVQVGSSGFSTSSLPDSKYYDLYDYQDEDGVGYTRYHLGDATREVLKNTSSQGGNAWWSDYSYNIYGSEPWVLRGGGPGSGSNAGVFDFNRENGWSYTIGSFRSVLTAN